MNIRSGVIGAIDNIRLRFAIARRLNLSADVVDKSLEFLLQTGLCVEEEGRIGPGPQSTFIEAGSPLVSRHHGNWRIKAMERHPTLKRQEELSYSAPVSLSSRDVLKVREILAHAIEMSDEIIAPSSCERFYCLNVDWFEVG
jgi:hypothetical protein